MMNNYIPLCFIALVATIQTVQTIDNNEYNEDYKTDNNDDMNINFLINNDLQDYENREEKIARDVPSRRSKADVIFYQRLRNGQCLVEYNGQFLTENTVIQIRKRLYRVENCVLERVFHACGPNLLLMLNVVCRVIEQTTTTSTPSTATTPPATNFQHDAMSSAASFFHRKYPHLSRLSRASKTPRVITESCCESLCTISELTRYCHR